MTSLDHLMEQNSIVTLADLQKILHFYPTTSKSNISFNHILLKWKNDQNLEHEFLKFIISRIVYYVFKHSDYTKDGKILKECEEKIKNLFPKAVELFAKKQTKTGELGELILFLLLESQNIVQLVNKMSLKTSPEELIKGSDATHIQIKNNKITLYFGESKFYTRFQNGLCDSVKSLEKFIEKNEYFEFSIISQHMDDEKFDDHVDQIKDLLLPYSTIPVNYDKRYPVYLGFEWDELKKLPVVKSIQSYVLKKYQADHEKFNNKIISTVEKSKINTSFLDFYLMPFQNIADFRKKFIEELKK